MAIQKRPDEKIFASSAGSQEVSAFPNIEKGWGFTFEETGGIPTMEHFNALFKRIDEHFNYVLQRGLPEWSATLDYPVGAYVQYDNKTYRSKKASKNQRPDIVDSTYWVRWSIDYKEVSSFIDEAGKKGVPLGSVVAFPKHITPHGYLKAIGGTFNQATYPDLYVANGNSNILPNLHRSDVGMTAYFVTDSIPDGWIAFDSIRTTVTQQSYPELYQYLVAKYGSIAQVPLAEDRFIRNAGNGLNVGATQNDEIKKHTHRTPLSHNSNDYQQMSQYYNDVSSVLTAPFVMALDGSDGTNNVYARQKNNLAAEGGEETRPKSIVLKLCIKAKNSFDDVQFWIKAFGEVVNAGSLDIGALAQDLQNKANISHAHQVSDIVNFDQKVLEVVSDSFSLQKIGTFEIRKYHDGTMIQTNRVSLPDSQINSKREFNWAVAFTERPFVVHSLDMSIYRHNDASLTTATVHNESTNTKCVFATREWTAVFQTEVHLVFLAIGRWK
ncbi:TPA: tail fiber protein [Pasteurella multocida]|uniref:tail fiber protein n=1 Tax=Pasteurella multocida TaxID=747 RepID=UPI0013F4123E|nr:tail fiber protein [Pasteurella multocida]MEB3468194.1 tail fiber protein [Pasteurella multocida]MEB3486774.1 tail fiber protein [Pasteurella multocida]MEB3499947.1 tail fiber protein [Pasteurella multocida]HDR1132623.1 tail fiber protein [Pasteurella multocida]HDR1134458.1 tail fiber protein [Pasteurella multocida]